MLHRIPSFVTLTFLASALASALASPHAHAAAPEVVVSIPLTNSALYQFVDPNTASRIEFTGTRDVQGNLAQMQFRVFKGAKPEPSLEGPFSAADGRADLTVEHFSGRFLRVRLDGITVLNPPGTEGADGTNAYSAATPRTVKVFRLSKTKAAELGSVEVPETISYSFDPEEEEFLVASETSESVITRGKGLAKKSIVSTNANLPALHSFTPLSKTLKTIKSPRSPVESLVAPYKITTVNANDRTNVYYRSVYPSTPGPLQPSDLPPLNYSLATGSEISPNGKFAIFKSFSGEIHFRVTDTNRITDSSVQYTETYKPF